MVQNVSISVENPSDYEVQIENLPKLTAFVVKTAE